jgi:hypothetical protein
MKVSVADHNHRAIPAQRSMRHDCLKSPQTPMREGVGDITYTFPNNGKEPSPNFRETSLVFRTSLMQD